MSVLKENGYRQFNTVYIEVPKKQGKSELAAAAALFLLWGNGKMRRAAPEEKETLSQQKKGLTDQISVLRKDLKLVLGVEKRSLDMVDRIKATDGAVNKEKESTHREDRIR